MNRVIVAFTFINIIKLLSVSGGSRYYSWGKRVIKIYSILNLVAFSRTYSIEYDQTSTLVQKYVLIYSSRGGGLTPLSPTWIRYYFQ